MDWAVLVSSQGGRMVMGPGRQPIGPIQRKPSALGFGPISVGYLAVPDERRVVIHGTTIVAFRNIRLEHATGADIEVAIVRAKRDLGCNIFLALPRRKPSKVVVTTLNGDGAFLNLDSFASGFAFQD